MIYISKQGNLNGILPAITQEQIEKVLRLGYDCAIHRDDVDTDFFHTHHESLWLKTSNKLTKGDRHVTIRDDETCVTNDNDIIAICSDTIFRHVFPNIAVYSSGRVMGWHDARFWVKPFLEQYKRNKRNERTCDVFASLNIDHLDEYHQQFVEEYDVTYWLEPFHVPEEYASIQSSSNNVANVCSMCFHHNKAMHMISQLNYDLVVFLRVETISDQTLRLEDIVSIHDKDILYIPSLEDHGGINDRLAISSVSTMSRYASLYDHLYTYYKQRNYFHPETLLRHHLEVCNIHVERFPFTFLLSDSRRETFSRRICFAQGTHQTGITKENKRDLKVIVSQNKVTAVCIRGPHDVFNIHHVWDDFIKPHILIDTYVEPHAKQVVEQLKPLSVFYRTPADLPYETKVALELYNCCHMVESLEEETSILFDYIFIATFHMTVPKQFTEYDIDYDAINRQGDDIFFFHRKYVSLFQQSVSDWCNKDEAFSLEYYLIQNGLRVHALNIS